jgi:type VI protein secretion system component Hcp
MSLYLDMKAAGTEIAGDATVDGYIGQIKLLGLSHGYQAPMSRGAVRSGKVDASQIQMHASVGPHAIIIWKALVENEEIEATIVFDPSDDGDAPEWTIEILDAKIGSIEFGYGAGGALSDNSVSFSVAFNEITISHEADGIAHMDTINI